MPRTVNAREHIHPSAPSSGFDVCVVGHVTRDIVKVGQTTRTIPGGTAYYTAVVLRRLGLDVAVVTKGAEEDKESLLKELLANGVTVFWKGGGSTSVFENSYSGDDLNTRTQVLKSMGTPFLAEDVEGISASAFHLGPLIQKDIPFEALKQVAKKAKILSLDAQGMVRPAQLGRVLERDWPAKDKWLKLVHILKADDAEGFILTGERDAERSAAVLCSFGPREVIITLGNRGSVVYTEGTVHKIPGLRPRKLKDPTGCGDTYMAGYLYERLRGTSPDMAGQFAAAMATLKLEGTDPCYPLFAGRLSRSSAEPEEASF